MALLDEAETAIGAATGTGWIRIALKLAPFVAIAALAAALFVTRATLARVKLEHRVELADAARGAAERAAADQQRVAKAADEYAARTAALQPVIVRSTDIVRTYAETPAGRAPCLGAERMRGIDELDTAIAAGAAPSGAGAVPADAGAPAGGRNGEQR